MVAAFIAMEDLNKDEIRFNVMKVTSFVDMVRAALAIPLPGTVKAGKKCLSECDAVSPLSAGEEQHDDSAMADTVHVANDEATIASSASSSSRTGPVEPSENAEPEVETSAMFGPENSKRSEQFQSKGFKRRRGGQNAAYFTYWSKQRRM